MTKKSFAIIFIHIFALQLFAEGYESLHSLFINGGVTWIKKEGSESDYIPGVNSFPVVPAHNNLVLGGSMNFKIYRKLSLELGGNLYNGKKITLIDPGDMDELKYRTQNFYSVYLSFLYNFTSTRIIPYISLGSGMKFVRGASGENVNTKYGYSVILKEVSRTNTALLRLGAGVKMYLIKGLAIRVEGSYIYSWKDKKSLFQILGGFQLF